MLGVYLIDLVKPGVWYQKYLVMASVPAIGLLALAVDRLGRRLLPLVLVVLVVLSGVAVAQNVEGDNPVRQDWSGAADIVAAGYHPGDVVAVLPAFNANALGYYWSGRTPIWGLLRHSYEVDDTITVDLRQIHDGHTGSVLWLVTSHAESFDPGDEVSAYLHDNFPLLSADVLPAGVVVASYRIPPGPLPPPPPAAPHGSAAGLAVLIRRRRSSAVVVAIGLVAAGLIVVLTPPRRPTGPLVPTRGCCSAPT